jgi:hypothetical protein
MLTGACLDISEEDLGRDSHQADPTGQPVESSSEPLLTTPLGEYAQGPGGHLIHRSCLHEVPNGASFDDKDQVTASGLRIKDIPPCSYPEGATAARAVSPAVNGWVVASIATPVNGWNYSQITEIAGTWTVPAKPARSGAVIFMFNALQDNTSTVIMQPVLQYGNNGRFGGNKWVLASWYGGPMFEGNYFHSSPIDVSPGEVIEGLVHVTVTGNIDCDASGVCDGWTIRGTVNGDTSRRSTIFATSSQPMSMAVAGALELYNVTNCNQLPSGSGGVTTFSDVRVYQPWGNPGNPSNWDRFQRTTFNGDCATTSAPCWNRAVWSQAPNCSFGVSVAASSARLTY